MKIYKTIGLFRDSSKHVMNPQSSREPFLCPDLLLPKMDSKWSYEQRNFIILYIYFILIIRQIRVPALLYFVA